MKRYYLKFLMLSFLSMGLFMISSQAYTAHLGLSVEGPSNSTCPAMRVDTGICGNITFPETNNNTGIVLDCPSDCIGYLTVICQEGEFSPVEGSCTPPPLQPSALTSPPLGLPITSSPVVFEWAVSPSPGAHYSLFVGTSSGADDLLSLELIRETSSPPVEIPINGDPIYFLLNTHDAFGQTAGFGGQYQTFIHQTVCNNNGICQEGETCDNCPQDCGYCYYDCQPFEYDTGVCGGATIPGAVNNTGVVVECPSECDGSLIAICQSGEFAPIEGSCTAPPLQPSALIAPPLGVPITASPVVFEWAASPSPGAYYSLIVGTSPGASDLLNLQSTTETSSPRVDIPTNGNSIHFLLNTFDTFGQMVGFGGQYQTAVIFPICNNGLCQEGETCDSCPQDCGECPSLDTHDQDQPAKGFFINERK